MPIKPCSFIRETGRQCGSPAMRGEDRCFFHQRDHLRRQILATWRVSGGTHLLASMALPPLDTPEEVQICINTVFLAIAENKIDPETRRTLIDMLRLASRNLRTAALIRHFAAREARLAKKQQLDAQSQGKDRVPTEQVPHVREANVGESEQVVEQSFSSADQTSDEESAAASLFEQELAPALEEMPPQEADVELQAQLKSREDDVKAFDKWVAQRVWVAPPKPKPKSEVYIPPSPFPRDPSDEAYIETQDPSTAAPSSTDSGRLRSG